VKWDEQSAYALRTDRRSRESRHRGTKTNTRKWCKGKVGVEHTPEVVKGECWGHACKEAGWYSQITRTWQPRGGWVCWHIVACSQCGKHLSRAPVCPDMPTDRTFHVR
jgi:hypothetical protein